MTEFRSSDDLVTAYIDLEARFKNLEAIFNSRISRRPTGDIEPTIRTIAKTNTLFVQGQTLSRVAFPVLYQFAEENSLFATGLFGVGDGSTTFVLPNYVGKVLIGSGTGVAVGQEIGADSRTLSIANIPSHDHNVSGSATSVGNHDHGASSGGGGGHSHSGTTSTNGSHGDHPDFPIPVAAGAGAGVQADAEHDAGSHSHTFGTSTNGDHGHSINVDLGGGHGHTVTISESTVGSGSAFDVRQASKGIGLLIYI